ncbi:pyrophosphate-fructose 6-phosphate 1-phosphotransferase subunit beta-like protein [Trifolium pratense]|uniref:Pyrophosphate-fructose 6-phosphate 1-phosphotransferase subunit beta-like protein n=1 Tax=Trifolium pratense TaxID=57577 RepID=A0A2K3L3I7_TRIPR|nr:pyrophosphate-fructose 6-phosphate 1-phosphotransferase subunit beta-like protein [Trifolium pratense]
MVEAELEKREQEGKYKGTKGDVVYQLILILPTAMHEVMVLDPSFKVGNLGAPVEEWTVGGTALTSLMDVERRHGKSRPVIKKAMVELEDAPFKKFASLRDEWALTNCYISQGPIQFTGPGSDAISHTLLLELGVQA